MPWPENRKQDEHFRWRCLCSRRREQWSGRQCFPPNAGNVPLLLCISRTTMIFIWNFKTIKKPHFCTFCDRFCILRLSRKHSADFIGKSEKNPVPFSFFTYDISFYLLSHGFEHEGLKSDFLFFSSFDFVFIFFLNLLLACWFGWGFLFCSWSSKWARTHGKSEFFGPLSTLHWDREKQGNTGPCLRAQGDTWQSSGTQRKLNQNLERDSYVYMYPCLAVICKPPCKHCVFCIKFGEIGSLDLGTKQVFLYVSTSLSLSFVVLMVVGLCAKRNVTLHFYVRERAIGTKAFPCPFSAFSFVLWQSQAGGCKKRTDVISTEKRKLILVGRKWPNVCNAANFLGSFQNLTQGEKQLLSSLMWRNKRVKPKLNATENWTLDQIKNFCTHICFLWKLKEAEAKESGEHGHRRIRDVGHWGLTWPRIDPVRGPAANENSPFQALFYKTAVLCSLACVEVPGFGWSDSRIPSRMHADVSRVVFFWAQKHESKQQKIIGTKVKFRAVIFTVAISKM